MAADQMANPGQDPVTGQGSPARHPAALGATSTAELAELRLRFGYRTFVQRRPEH